MKVRLGQLEFVDLTPEELEDLVQRYGETAGFVPSDAPKPLKSGQNPQEGGPRDSLVLRTFTEAGANGVAAKKVGSLLGRRGKAMRSAARKWAVRVGLAHAGIDPFEECRVGTARGIRIKSDLLDLAKELLKGGGGS